MPQATEPTRLQLDLREDTWIAPGLTALPWATTARAGAGGPGPAAGPECGCPTDCARDHEYE